MNEKHKGIRITLPKEKMEKLVWFDKNISRVAKILTGRLVGDPRMAEEELPPLSFSQYLVGSIFFLIFILMIIFGLFATAGGILQLFSGK